MKLHIKREMEERRMAITAMEIAQEMGRIIAQNKGIMWMKAYISEVYRIYFESNIQIEKHIQDEIQYNVVPMSMECIFNQSPATECETVIKVAMINGEPQIQIGPSEVIEPKIEIKLEYDKEYLKKVLED